MPSRPEARPQQLSNLVLIMKEEDRRARDPSQACTTVQLIYRPNDTEALDNLRLFTRVMMPLGQTPTCDRNIAHELSLSDQRLLLDI